MIGSLVSQWAAQYLISFGYRYVMSLHKNRYKDQTKVSHALIFMDDIILTGSNRRELLIVVHMLQKYMFYNFGLRIKQTYHIKRLTNEVAIDMMGFRMYKSGKVSIRTRNFIKLRRMVLRFNSRRNISYSSAKHVISYKGFYKNSNSYKLNSIYHAKNMFNISQNIISKYERGVLSD